LVITSLAVLATGMPAAGALPWWWPPQPAPVTCAGPSIPKATGGNWTCTFDDEFNATRLDLKKWLPITTAGNGIASRPACFVNSTNNISESGGVLDLTARMEAAPFTCHSPKGDFTSQYTTGQVATYGKFSQTYGRFAVSAKFPATTIAGLQSALWLWPQNNAFTGLTGEIDIAEEYSSLADRAVPFVHYPYDPLSVSLDTNTNVVTNNYCLISDVNAFHAYAVEWTSTTIKVIYDGQTCLTDNLSVQGASPFNQPYFVALTQALGMGKNAFDPATTPLPATTQVDWVRVWK
jgi:beta-glucanase (GH16 family)